MKEQLKEAAEAAAKFLAKYPDKKKEVQGFLDLLESEIADGESPDNELNHFLNTLDELEFELHYGED